MESAHLKGLHKSSKPIKKKKSARSRGKNSPKKYKTYLKQKPLIQGDLREGVVNWLMKHRMGLLPEKLKDRGLSELIDLLPKDAYNGMLSKILRKHISSFVQTKKSLRIWHNTINNWNKRTGKPETRGGLVVPPQKLQVFLKKATVILKAMPFRSFPLLQAQLLPILKDFHNERQNGDNFKPFDSKTCSKHWWFDFIRKHVALKELWESLPLERTFKARKKSFQSRIGSVSLSPVSVEFLQTIDHSSTHDTSQPGLKSPFSDVETQEETAKKMEEEKDYDEVFYDHKMQYAYDEGDMDLFADLGGEKSERFDIQLRNLLSGASL